jgi:hypothetical protein
MHGEVEINGEYWIQNGSVDYADGDIGDQNHESIAIQSVVHQYADEIADLAEEHGLGTALASAALPHRMATATTVLKRTRIIVLTSCIMLRICFLTSMPDPLQAWVYHSIGFYMDKEKVLELAEVSVYIVDGYPEIYRVANRARSRRSSEKADRHHSVE